MRSSVLLLFCISIAFALAQSCSFLSASGLQYDLTPAIVQYDIEGLSDGTPYTYYYTPCRNTAKCTSVTIPPSPSPFCQTPAIGSGFFFGCGSLNYYSQGDLYPLGSGFWTQYAFGDRTASGARSVNVSCSCVSVPPLNSVFATGGTYETPNAPPGTYQATFASKYCCPTSPTPSPPFVVNETCLVCEEAVSAVRLLLAYQPSSSQSALDQFLQPLCNVTVPTLSDTSFSQCESVLNSYAKEIVTLASDANVNPNAICLALNLCGNQKKSGHIRH